MSTPNKTGIDIELRTKASGTGASDTAKAIDGVTSSSKKATTATVDHGKAVNDLGENFDKGAAAGRVLGEVSRGNVLALGQLGPVLKGLAALFKTNPLFLIGSIAATIILPAIAKIAAGWKSVEERAKEAGKASAEAGAAALAAASTRQDNALAKTYKEIADRAAEARANIDAVTIAQTAQLDADEAVALAEVQADKSISEVERLRRTGGIRREFRGRRFDRELGALDAQESVSAQRVTEAQSAAAEARAREQSGRAFVSTVATRSPETIKAEIQSAKAAEEAAGVAATTLPGIFSSKNREALEEATLRRSVLEAELADSEANYATRLKAAQDALLARIAAREKAEAEAEEAARAAAAERNVNTARRAALDVTRASQDVIDEIKTPGEIEAAATKDIERRQANERANSLELIGADSANTGTAFAQRLLSTPAGKTDEKVKAAAEALREAAAAAREGGTNESEAQALLTALVGVREVLAANSRTSATLMREISTLQSQVNALRKP